MGNLLPAPACIQDVFRSMGCKGICCSNNVIYTDNKMAHNAGPYYQPAAGSVSDSALEENRNVTDCLIHIAVNKERENKHCVESEATLLSLS